MVAAGGGAGKLVAGLAVMLVVLVGMVGVPVIAVLGASVIEVGGCEQAAGPGGGPVITDQQPVDAGSMDLARTITQTTLQRRLPRKAAVLAVATAMVESGLRNLTYGDRDSLGLFQQRPSQGWGTPAQILQPTYATGRFLDALVALPGWANLPPGVAEQRVQRSAFPDRYAPREPAATGIVSRFWTGPDTPTPGPDAVSGGVVEAVSRCPDTGGSDTPLHPGGDRTRMPAGFSLPTDPRQAAAVGYAVAQLGKPYVWGAKGPSSFDCSGLMLAAWAAAGIGIPAGTINQVHTGTPVASLEQAQAGDLVFIPGSLGTAQVPRHVGMYAGHGLIIDAYDTSTGVIVEPLTSWTRTIVAIRRPTPESSSPPAGGSPPT